MPQELSISQDDTSIHHLETPERELPELQEVNGPYGPYGADYMQEESESDEESDDDTNSSDSDFQGPTGCVWGFHAEIARGKGQGAYLFPHWSPSLSQWSRCCWCWRGCWGRCWCWRGGWGGWGWCGDGGASPAQRAALLASRDGPVHGGAFQAEPLVLRWAHARRPDLRQPRGLPHDHSGLVRPRRHPEPPRRGGSGPAGRRVPRAAG